MTEDARSAVARALGRAERRLELARRDTPRIDTARSALLEQRRATRDEIRDIDQALSALATRDELVLRTRDSINVQSYVRGRIAQYLETTEDTGDAELEQLKRQVEHSRSRTSQPWPQHSTPTRSDPAPNRCCAPSAAR